MLNLDPKMALQYIRDSWKTETAYFPGPQPISIERRHFSELKKQPYLVCEKTDGLRNLLVSTPDGVIALVNRANVVVPIKIKVPKDTLLDGELVQLKNSDQWIFSVYDAIKIKGESVMHLPLDQRLSKTAALVQRIIKMSGAPFEIHVKKMIRFENMKELPDLNTFPYETDGIVFTPINEPVRTGTHETMFKFKPLEKITIDFYIKDGKDLHIQDKHVLLRKGTCAKQDIKDGTIVECGFVDGSWVFEKIRADKKYPNNLRTYLRTCVNIGEDIQMSEFIV